MGWSRLLGGVRCVAGSWPEECVWIRIDGMAGAQARDAVQLEVSVCLCDNLLSAHRCACTTFRTRSSSTSSPPSPSPGSYAAPSSFHVLLDPVMV